MSDNLNCFKDAKFKLAEPVLGLNFKPVIKTLGSNYNEEIETEFFPLENLLDNLERPKEEKLSQEQDHNQKTTKVPESTALKRKHKPLYTPSPVVRKRIQARPSFVQMAMKKMKANKAKG